MNTPDVFLLGYEMDDGKRYVMTLFGSKEEAFQHCENLDLEMMGEVVMVLPFDNLTDTNQYH